jgi:hypothetical protein
VVTTVLTTSAMTFGYLAGRAAASGSQIIS